ncbi:phage tail protein [Chitinophaga sp. SYP-B3965]|uniref:phage tail protein n=1 Tax=Chitinophaga sp. SYP-B3965 TaxID=2663120 RepID=UPI001299797D|nr:tail fiber protein [Chitinophaga sp. SYP-B3965]MRG46697.1 phage tail protein [Chitinophaga sp. SYP-B3965]
METFISAILLWAPNFAPRGWAFCAGQLLSIAQNTALFSLLGTTYGGNGQTNFGLPDFRGRVPVGVGQGPNLSNYELGQFSGSENVILTINQMPSHTHAAAMTVTVSASNAASTSNVAAAGASTPGALADPSTGNPVAGYNNATPNIPLNVGGVVNGTIQPAGNNQPFSIMQPYLAINFIIAMEGIFPSRS